MALDDGQAIEQDESLKAIMAMVQNQWYHFGIGEFTTRFRLYFSGDWDVHWGYDLGFCDHCLVCLSCSTRSACTTHDAPPRFRCGARFNTWRQGGCGAGELKCRERPNLPMPRHSNDESCLTCRSLVSLMH